MEHSGTQASARGTPDLALCSTCSKWLVNCYAAGLGPVLPRPGRLSQAAEDAHGRRGWVLPERRPGSSPASSTWRHPRGFPASLPSPVTAGWDPRCFPFNSPPSAAAEEQVRGGCGLPRSRRSASGGDRRDQRGSALSLPEPLGIVGGGELSCLE